jgi:endonuclease III
LLVANKVGQYGRIERALRESLNLDLRTASVAELMNVFGVGAKSSRFFVLHSRANCDCAVLDVHILRWMRKRGIQTPEQTPSGKKYLELERVFLALARGEFPNVPIAQVDLLIWATESGRITQEFAANECECCETGNPVEYIAEQSYDKGATRTKLRVCGMCAEYWNEGGDWDAPCVKIVK